MKNTNPIKKNYYLDLYFKKKYYLNEIDKINKVFDKVNLLDFEKSVKQELSDFEKETIAKYNYQGIKLKDIAAEIGFSYSYVRRVYLEGIDKMRIILNMTMKKK